MLQQLFFNIIKVLSFLKKFNFFFILLILFSLITALFEILFLISIIPFFSIIFDTQINENIFYYKFLIFFFGNYFENQTVFFTFLFGILSIIVGILRLVLLRLNIIFTAKTSAYLGDTLFENILLRPFSFHVNLNSSELISLITQKNNDISNLIMSIVLLSSNFIIFISIFLCLLFLKTSLVLVVSIFFFVIYFFIELLSRKVLLKNSKIIADNQSKVVKSLQESFGAIKEIIMQNLQQHYIKIFSKSNSSIHTKIGQNRLISQFPRYIVETGTLLLLCVIVLYYSNKNLDIVNILPLLTAIAIGVQRLLPLMQQIYFNFSNIVGKKSALDDYVKIYNQELFTNNFDQTDQRIIFDNHIKLENINLSYGQKKIFENLNIKIKKNSCVGVVGKTGSGKTTFIHLLNGLIFPDKGKVIIDDVELNQKNFKNWVSKITYVPQEIFLFDDTISRNIALGKSKDEIDYDKLYDVCKKAQILDLIESKKDRFEEKIGERGIKLSAGERQRLGIARALYSNPKILILDEATSALDYNTEKKIMTSIYSMKINTTIIIIAHRLNTLEQCENIIDIEEYKMKYTK